MGRIILIGFMGCGKSTIGIKLSYRLRCPITDTDKLIEKEEGRSVSEIFEKDGEEYFRNMETACIKKLKGAEHDLIISVGGGLPLREENRRLLKELGTVIYLRAKADTIYERLKNDNSRPLLQCDNPMEKIRTLMEGRRFAYENAADIIVDVDNKGFEDILGEIELHIRNIT